jgi:hypothetical protein
MKYKTKNIISDKLDIEKQLKSYINNTKIIKKLRDEKKEGYKSLINMYQWVLNVSSGLLKHYKNKDEDLFFDTVKEFNFLDELEQANQYNIKNNKKR